MRIEEVCDVTDILPTLMDLAGIDERLALNPLDGISFLPLLDGKERAREKMSFNYADAGWPPTDQPWTPEGVKDEYRPLTERDIAGLNPASQVISLHHGDYKLLFNPASYDNTPNLHNNKVLLNIKLDPTEENNLLPGEEEVFTFMDKELYAWFEEVKNSPHAFQMPVFQVSGNESVISAWAPVQISPEMKNAFNFLKGWQQGSQAVYSIQVKEEGEFQVRAEWLNEADHVPILEIKTGDNQSGIRVNSRSTLKLMEGPAQLVVSCKAGLDREAGLKHIILVRK
jgi:hypothetical protein